MKAFMTTLLSLISIIYPMEQNHTSNMCCMSCAMKKEDEVEFINYDYDLDGHD
jgi:hypothetical protein